MGDDVTEWKRNEARRSGKLRWNNAGTNKYVMERNKTGSDMARGEGMQGRRTRTNEQVARRNKAGSNEDENERMKEGRN